MIFTAVKKIYAIVILKKGMKLMAQKNHRRILSVLVSAAMLISAFTPFSALAAQEDYILNISDQKFFDHTTFTTSQDGSIDLGFRLGDGATISSDGQDMVSEEPIKLNQTLMNDWKSTFYTLAQNYPIGKPIVFDIQFKVYLDDYSVSSPQIGLRLNTNSGLFRVDAMGWRGIPLIESEKDKMHTMRFVLTKGEDGNALIYYSYDGAEYSTSSGTDAVTGDVWDDNGYTDSNGNPAEVRFYPTAVPSGDRLELEKTWEDGVTPLDTPVNWEFYSFTAYQSDDIPPASDEPQATPTQAPEEDIDYVLNISDQKYFNHNTQITTQDGSADLNYFGGTGSTITSDGQDMVSSEPIKVRQTITSDWKTTFYTPAQNFSTSLVSVFDIQYKVSLEDYTVPSPYVGLRLYTNNNAVNTDGLGWRGIQLIEADADKVHNMRFVLVKGDDGKAHVYYSLDGADYEESIGADVPADAENWGYIVNEKGGQMRFMPVAIPNEGRKAADEGIQTWKDDETPLETPVNWEFYSFKAYQTDEVPNPPSTTNPPSEDGKDYILNLSDNKVLDDKSLTITQNGSIGIKYFGSNSKDGSLATRVYSDTPQVATSGPIKVEQIKASEYKTSFMIPGENFTTDKNIVFDVKFKVSLEDYSKTSPYIGVKLSHNPYPDKSVSMINETNGMGWRGIQLTEAEKDDMHTMRFVIANNGNETNPNAARIYYSYDGAPYSTEDRSTADLSNFENYGTGDFRIWPVAIPQRENFVIKTDDGETPLDTPVNWEIYSITAYQTDEVPGEGDDWGDEGGEGPLPTALPVPTAVPIPSDLQGNIVRSYPEGKMKAAVISLDDGADWCVDKDLKAIEILKSHGAKATFNVVPGNVYGTFLDDLKTNYEGMEVASHSYTHPQLDEVSNDEFRRELQLSKTAIENALGEEIGGLAYPYSCAASSDPERLRMIQDIGYRYARNCIMTGKFDVPESFYDLNPTGWITIERDWDNGTTQGLMDSFKDMDASKEWKMMLLAGHAWQLSADESEPRGDIWYKFEEFAQYLEDNSDTIWNPTTIELVDYVTACRQLTVTKGEDGSINMYNPSQMNVWANVDGVPTEIPAGETVTVSVKAQMPERDFIAKEYLLDIDDNIVVDDKSNTIVDNGTLVSTSGVQSSSTNDVFVVRQQKKSIWGGYLNVTAPNPQEIVIDKPVVIEAKYNVTLDDYSVAVPKVRFAIALTDLGIYANTGVGTGIYAPAEGDGDKTVKFIIDPNTKKVYYTADGKTFNSYDASGLSTSSVFGSGIRLYMNVCPNDDNMSNDNDGSQDLTTNVYWNFDYVKMYKLEDDEALKLASDNLTVEGNTASYTVNVRNHYPSEAKSGTVLVALYNENGRLIKTDVQTISVDALKKASIEGSFDVTGLTNYTVKAFLWNGLDKITPFDQSYKLIAQ
jgi:peptidoglycan/xylan/chitin deacetylase (PgdA/CDA1 family)